MTRNRTPLPSTVDALSERIEEWRRNRSKLGRMPEDLWLEAAAMARDHGVTRVSRALRIDFASLKKRTGSSPSCSSPGPRVESGFVELEVSSSSPETDHPAAVVSLSRRDGSRLVVELWHSHPLDVVGLARAFLPSNR